MRLSWTRSPEGDLWMAAVGDHVASVLHTTFGQYLWSVSARGQALKTGYAETLEQAQPAAEGAVLELALGGRPIVG